jgi:hypothetical protein
MVWKMQRLAISLLILALAAGIAPGDILLWRLVCHG